MAKSPTVKELRALAKSAGLKRYSKMKKAELLQLLSSQAPHLHLNHLKD